MSPYNYNKYNNNRGREPRFDYSRKQNTSSRRTSDQNLVVTRNDGVVQSHAVEPRPGQKRNIRAVDGYETDAYCGGFHHASRRQFQTSSGRRRYAVSPPQSPEPPVVGRYNTQPRFVTNARLLPTPQFPSNSKKQAKSSFERFDEETAKLVVEMKEELETISPQDYTHASWLLRNEVRRLESNSDPEWIRFNKTPTDKIITVEKKVLIPQAEQRNGHSNPVNYVGRILGQAGSVARDLSSRYKCRLEVLGSGSTRDPLKEEEAFRSGDPKFAHFGGPLHVKVETRGAPEVVYPRIGGIIAELKQILYPPGESDGDDESDGDMERPQRYYDRQKIPQNAPVQRPRTYSQSAMNPSATSNSHRYHVPEDTPYVSDDNENGGNLAGFQPSQSAYNRQQLQQNPSVQRHHRVNPPVNVPLQRHYVQNPPSAPEYSTPTKRHRANPTVIQQQPRRYVQNPSAEDSVTSGSTEDDVVEMQQNTDNNNQVTTTSRHASKHSTQSRHAPIEHAKASGGGGGRFGAGKGGGGNRGVVDVEQQGPSTSQFPRQFFVDNAPPKPIQQKSRRKKESDAVSNSSI